MYQNILLATELTDNSQYIEEKAAAIQKLTNAKLSIIHVIEPIPYTSDELLSVYNYQEITEALQENAKKMLQPIQKRLNIANENSIIITGSVSYEVLNYAEENNIDLIISGSHGRHGLQLLLGSTANAILHGAKCDVLAVRFKE